MPQELSSAVESQRALSRLSLPAVERPTCPNSSSSHDIDRSLMPKPKSPRPLSPRMAPSPTTQLERESATDQLDRIKSPINVCSSTARFRYVDSMKYRASTAAEAIAGWSSAAQSSAQAQHLQQLSSTVPVETQQQATEPAADGQQDHISLDGASPVDNPSIVLSKAHSATLRPRTSAGVRSRSLSATDAISVTDDCRLIPHKGHSLPPQWSWRPVQNGKVIYECLAYPQWKIYSDVHPCSSAFVDLPLRQTAAPLGKLPRGYTGIL